MRSNEVIIKSNVFGVVFVSFLFFQSYIDKVQRVHTRTCSCILRCNH